MRILDINNNYSPVGGGCRTYHDQKQAWFAGRDDAQNALIIPSDREETIDTPGGPRFHVPAVKLGDTGYRMIIDPRPLRRVVQRWAPDVIEIGSIWTLPTLLPQIVGKTSIPTVAFHHTHLPDTHARIPLQRRMPGLSEWAGKAVAFGLGRRYQRFDAVCGASAYVLDVLSNNGVQRLFKTPLGVDSARFTPSRFDEAFRVSQDAPTDGTKQLVMYLGRFHPEKGIDLLFDAYPHLRDPDKVQLVIGGHGPWSAELKTFLQRYPEVKRLDYIADRDAVAAAFASVDCLLCLGEGESFSLATTEAMASGTPVIAPRRGGAGEQVDKAPFGETFIPRDAKDLARAIAAVGRVTGAQRAELRGHVVENYSWDKTFARLLSVYRYVHAATGGDVRVPLSGPEPWISLRPLAPS